MKIFSTLLFLLMMTSSLLAQEKSVKEEVLTNSDARQQKELNRIRETLRLSGSYLIKGRTHILEGIACGFVSGGVYYIGSTTYSNAVSRASEIGNLTGRSEELRIAKQNRNIIYTGAGILALTGITLEVIGILNIGKAGVVLERNGMGVRVNF